MTIEKYKYPDNPRGHSSNLDPGWDEIWPSVAQNDETLGDVQDQLGTQQDQLEAQQAELEKVTTALWPEGDNNYNNADPAIPDALSMLLGEINFTTEALQYWEDHLDHMLYSGSTNKWEGSGSEGDNSYTSDLVWDSNIDGWEYSINAYDSDSTVESAWAVWVLVNSKPGDPRGVYVIDNYSHGGNDDYGNIELYFT